MVYDHFYIFLCLKLNLIEFLKCDLSGQPRPLIKETKLKYWWYVASGEISKDLPQSTIVSANSHNILDLPTNTS